MGTKRAREGVENSRPRKAPKRSEKAEEVTPVPIHTARQLRSLLHFRQDDVDALRTAQASLKAFLESIANVDLNEDADRHTKLAILKDFTEHEQTELLQTWSFGAQTDNERLVIAVTSNIALLLRTLSGLLDFREQGLAFAKSLLQREQLKLFSRGLSAESHKEALISPCLRILTEVVSFDGGVLAGQVFRHQDFTFNSKFLDRNLRLYRSSGDEERRRPSVRSNTVRYILAHLRHQGLDDRISMLAIRSVFRNVFENIRNDPVDLVQDTLKVVESAVLKEQEIPRKLKSSMLSERSLISIVDAVRAMPEDSSGATQARSFLLKVCTISDLGIHLPSSWYPPSKDRSRDDFESAQTFHDTADVRNIIISKFVPYLRSHSDLQERALLLAIFEATPELVADYFRQAASMLSLQPKLTNTWLGYASLMYSIIQIPLPQYFGLSNYRSIPPDADVILENILPAPLTREVLTRCLNQTSNLITFFALRILVITLEKTTRVYDCLKVASAEFGSYETILASFEFIVAKRLPTFKDVVATYRAVAKYEEQGMTQETAAHALQLYQRVLPEAVTEEFDVAGPLATVLESLQKPELALEGRSLLQLHLAHLLELARTSSNMLWWQRQAKMIFSPFVTIVKIITESASLQASPETFTELLSSIAAEDGILQSSTPNSATDALLASLESTKHWKPTLEVWRFIDDCLGRSHKKPIKYLDDLDTLLAATQTESSRATISLLALVVMEQVPFASRLSDIDRDAVLNWSLRFATALEKIGENDQVTAALLKQIEAQDFSSCKVKLRSLKSQHAADGKVEESSSRINGTSDDTPPMLHSDRGLQITFAEPDQESEKHPALTRYKRQDIEDIVQGEVLDDLMLCLCSIYPEIRRQGVTAIQDVMEKLEASTLESKDQIWLLLGDLIETAASSLEERPLSYLAGSFATASHKVVVDPTHFMFPLINRYLLKDPYWEVRKIPDYFLRKALLETPGEDEKYWPQVEWILSFLLGGIKRAEDAMVFRHRNALERTLSLVHSPTVTTKATMLVLQIVHRLCTVGGSTTLITNAGIEAWLSGLTALPRGVSADTLEALRKAIEQNVDLDRARQWYGTQGATAKSDVGKA
ncbi:Ribosome 60S biogenesis N-terminal domain-containing protein [Elsinoe fawcettii]|nr:Ribosome 60S biogenesis N-terminal domain-containing protein [Elsinoe fawcettii]